MSDIPQRNIRWLPVFNATSPKETIPGFALMAVAGGVVLNGQHVFNVAKHDSGIASESNQFPSRMIFNGPTPIPPERYGQGTQDCPARALIEAEDMDFSEAETAIHEWGAQDDSWYLKPVARGPFHDIGLDRSTVPLGSGESLLWVQRGNIRPPVYSSTFRNNLTEIQPGDPVAPVADTYRDPASEGLPSGVLATAVGLYTTLSGSYLFGFSGSLYSNSAPRGTQLTLRLYRSTNPDTVISGSADMTATSYNVVRTQDIETDEYGADILTTMENVAMGGPIQLTAGDSIAIINDSAYPVVVAAVNFWAMLVMPHAVEAEGE